MQTKLPATTSIRKHKDRSSGGDFFIQKNAAIVLSDGTSFSGTSPEWQKNNYTGEVVFNTGMTGYTESLTDPSYAGQILVFTYPLIGNYGINERTTESEKIHVHGVIVSEAATHWSHSLSSQSILAWLYAQNVPILMNVDTRALTKYLRNKGTMMGTIGEHAKAPKKVVVKTHFVSIDKPQIYNNKKTKRVILVDCGSKQNILDSLLKLPIQIKRVPYNYDYTDESYDGVLLSNGPGNPADYAETIAITQKALTGDRPVFGICLGSQIMGLAAGAKTYKLKFGHRGHNQPCVMTDGNHCFITSQNHGYAIDEKTLPKGWSVAFRNLNDNSVEGILHNTKPFHSVQFHPEANPGPTDTAWLFERFYKSL